MAAMFVFLTIYVAVVPPRVVAPLTIHTVSLPRAVWARPYEAAITVSGGEGPYQFILGPSEPLADLNLWFDVKTAELPALRPGRPSTK